jgi:hypothetical protein
VNRPRNVSAKRSMLVKTFYSSCSSVYCLERPLSVACASVLCCLMLIFSKKQSKNVKIGTKVWPSTLDNVTV